MNVLHETQNRFKMPARRNNRYGSQTKTNKSKSQRENNSLDNIVLPELKNKQTFKLYQDQLEQIVGNEQMITRLHKDLAQSQGFNQIMGRQVNENIESNKKIRDIINQHQTQSGYLLEDQIDNMKVTRPLYARHQNIFSIVYPREFKIKQKKEEMNESRQKEVKTYELLKQLYMVHVQYINKMIRNMPFNNNNEQLMGMFKDIQSQFRMNTQDNIDPKEQIVEINKLIRNLTKLKKKLQTTLKEFQLQQQQLRDKRKAEEELRDQKAQDREMLKQQKLEEEERLKREEEEEKLRKQREAEEKRKNKDVFLTEQDQDKDKAEQNRLAKEARLLEEQKRKELEEEEKRKLEEFERLQKERRAEEKRLAKEEKARLKEEERLRNLSQAELDEEERLRELERQAELKRKMDEEERERQRLLQKEQRNKSLQLMEEKQKLDLENEREKERQKQMERAQKQLDNEQRKKQRELDRANQQALKEAQDMLKKMSQMADDERQKLKREEEERLRLIREAEEFAKWKIDNHIYEYDKEKYQTTFAFVKDCINEKLLLRNFQETIEILAEVQIYRKLQFVRKTVNSVIQRSDEEFLEMEIDTKNEIEKLKRLQMMFDKINLNQIKDQKASELKKEKKEAKEMQLEVYLRFFNEINEYKLIYQEGEEGFKNKGQPSVASELQNIDVEEIRRRRKHFIEEREQVMAYFKKTVTVEKKKKKEEKEIKVRQRQMNSREEEKGVDEIEQMAVKFRENNELKRQMKSYFSQSKDDLKDILLAVQNKQRPARPVYYL